MRKRVKPVIVTTECRTCGGPWVNHGQHATLLDCIRVLRDLNDQLRAEVAEAQAETRRVQQSVRLSRR